MQRNGNENQPQKGTAINISVAIHVSAKHREEPGTVTQLKP